MASKLALLAGTMAFSALAMAGEKSYNFSLSEPVTVGEVQLAPGEYKLKIEGSNAVFNDTRTGKSFTVPAKVENADKRYNSTALGTTQQGSTEHLISIELGGSKTKLEFGE